MKGCIIDYDDISLIEIIKKIDNFDKYNCLITNIECYPLDKEISNILNEEYCWINGGEFIDLLKKEDFQWIWGVISLFDSDVKQKEVLEYSYPYADGYEGFWKNPITIQHPMAKLEIVAWDGGKILVISKNDTIVDNIIKSDLSVKDLEEYNRE